MWHSKVKRIISICQIFSALQRSKVNLFWYTLSSLTYCPVSKYCIFVDVSHLYIFYFFLGAIRCYLVQLLFFNYPHYRWLKGNFTPNVRSAKACKNSSSFILQSIYDNRMIAFSILHLWNRINELAKLQLTKISCLQANICWCISQNWYNDAQLKSQYRKLLMT